MIKPFLLLLLGFLPALPAAADFYRWVDEKGGVHYSDMPPPTNVRRLERVGTPRFSGADAAKSGPPVILYTGNCGPTCEQAAEFLGKRGMPFTERNVSRDREAAAQLKKRTGGIEVPVLFVGETMQRGYSPTLWDKMLEMAGYPATPKPGSKQQGRVPAEGGSDSAADSGVLAN